MHTRSRIVFGNDNYSTIKTKWLPNAFTLRHNQHFFPFGSIFISFVYFSSVFLSLHGHLNASRCLNHKDNGFGCVFFRRIDTFRAEFGNRSLKYGCEVLYNDSFFQNFFRMKQIQISLS